MASETDIVTVEVKGSIFTVEGTSVYDTDNPVPGRLTFNATNSAGKWVDVVVDNEFGRVWTSTHMNNGESVSGSRDLGGNAAKRTQITRWAPGAFGISGNGGGEVTFTMPAFGDVTINITVTG